MHEALVWLKAEVAQAAAGFSQLIIVGEDHAAFPCGNVFVGVEAKGTDVAKAAAGLAFVGLAVHLSGVFYHFQAVPLGDVQHGVYIHGQAEDVDDHDGLGTRGDLGFDLGDVHVPGDGVTIHQHRFATVAHDLSDAGNDGKGGHDDFITGANAQGFDSGIDGGCTVADGDPMLAAHACGELLFELLDEGAF